MNTITPLLVVLPFCEKDVHLVRPLLEWIDELRRKSDWIDSRLPNSIVLSADIRVKREVLLDLKAYAQTIFHFAEGVIVNVPDERQSWPKGPNFMFHNALQVVMERYKMPWLWLEPDAVPLKPDWLEQLSREYALCPKKFMGTMATVALTPELPQRHMSGVAVYPPDAYPIMKESCASDIAFDYASAKDVVGRNRCWETKLIYELWGDHTNSPTFKAFKAPEDKSNVVVPAAIPESAVLYHRCKDLSLTNLLRGSVGIDGGFSTLAEVLPAKEIPTQHPVDKVLVEMAKDEPPRKAAPKTRIGVPESKMATI